MVKIAYMSNHLPEIYDTMRMILKMQKENPNVNEMVFYVQKSLILNIDEFEGHKVIKVEDLKHQIEFR